MFTFFKRTKIAKWEMDLLKNVIEHLPEGYRHFQEQIDQGLFRSVLIGYSDIPGYVGFSFNEGMIDKFEKKHEKSFTLTGIRVFDKKSKEYLPYSIFFSAGTIIGYAVGGYPKYDLDINDIKVDFKTTDRDITDDFEKIRKHLTPAEINLLTPADIFEVTINGNIYYHLTDLEDGDFVGMDLKKNVFKITHNPLKVTPIKADLLDFLKSIQTNENTR
jgi:hypothetical protein